MTQKTFVLDYSSMEYKPAIVGEEIYLIPRDEWLESFEEDDLPNGSIHADDFGSIGTEERVLTIGDEYIGESETIGDYGIKMSDTLGYAIIEIHDGEVQRVVSSKKVKGIRRLNKVRTTRNDFPHGTCIRVPLSYRGNGVERLERLK